jgi:type I site-specific restriction endonuclease
VHEVTQLQTRLLSDFLLLVLNTSLSANDGRSLDATQLDFIQRIIDWLAQNGSIDPSLLWEAPFDWIHPQGVSGLFDETRIKSIVSTLQSFEPRIEKAGWRVANPLADPD